MNIAVLAIRRDKAIFLLRVTEQLRNLHKITFLTTRYHTYRHLKDKCDVSMLQDFIDDSVDITDCLEFKDDATLMETYEKSIEKDRLDKQFVWFCRGLKSFFSKKPVDIFLIWNGSTMQGYTASAIADLFDVKKLFFEIGNFPGKFFMDPKGVNAQSSLMEKDLCACGNYDEQKLCTFVKNHKQAKEEIHIVPQAKTLQRIPWERLWDVYYNCFARYPIVEKQVNYLTKLIKKYTCKIKINYDTVEINQHNYILFPLQVSRDSQVIRNSDKNLFESVDCAVETAEKNKLDLFIKPHPAETNKKILEYIYRLRSCKSNIFLVGGNTYQLIKHSKKVITINSTVGIEGLMYYKHVEVLGRAFYKPYCEPDLSKTVNKDRVNRFLFNYFFNILKDGDFFSDGPVHIDLTGIN